MVSAEVVIQHIELSLAPGDQPIYVASVIDPHYEGEEVGIRVEIMPADVFESRAAEYGIDVTKPGGWDDVLDIVFVGVPSASIDPTMDPDQLYAAPTIEHARKARLKAIRGDSKGCRVSGVSGHSENKAILGEALGIDSSGAEDPVEFIKRTAPMSKEHIKVKQEFVRRQRNQVRVRRAGRRSHEMVDMEQVTDQVRRDMKLMPERESSDDLAARLLGQPGPDNSRRTFAMNDTRDENDTPRNRLPPREGAPSKYL